MRKYSQSELIDPIINFKSTKFAINVESICTAVLHGLDVCPNNQPTSYKHRITIFMLPKNRFTRKKRRRNEHKQVLDQQVDTSVESSGFKIGWWVALHSHHVSRRNGKRKPRTRNSFNEFNIGSV